jgi:hypothetical protein
MHFLSAFVAKFEKFSLDIIGNNFFSRKDAKNATYSLALSSSPQRDF